MPDAKISIIVPVYDVELYLQRCLDSIVNQTYQNLEIILVDDGSPDNCGIICDRYAAQDKRIKVIHQSNMGLSAARNKGLDTATGNYIGFVDSDDWIETDMFEYMLNNAMKYHADIVVCGRTEVYHNHQCHIAWKQEIILNREEAIGFLLEDSMLQNYLCDKLWRQELFGKIRFPEGRNYEDIAITYQLFEKAEKIVCLPECKYFYLQRNNSIVQNKTLNNAVAYYTALLERYLYLQKHYPQFQEKMEKELILAIIRVCDACSSSSGKERKQHQRILEDMSAFIREHTVSVSAVAQNLGIAGKVKLKLLQHIHQWIFSLIWFINKLYELRHGKAL